MKIVSVEKRKGPGFVEWKLKCEIDPMEKDELIQLMKLRPLHRKASE